MTPPAWLIAVWTILGLPFALCVSLVYSLGNASPESRLQSFLDLSLKAGMVVFCVLVVVLFLFVMWLCNLL